MIKNTDKIYQAEIKEHLRYWVHIMKPLLLCHIRYNIGTRDLLNNSHENLKINCYPFCTILGIYRDFILIVKRAFELNAPPPIIFKSNNEIYDIEIIRTYISWVCEFNE